MNYNFFLIQLFIIAFDFKIIIQHYFESRIKTTKYRLIVLKTDTCRIHFRFKSIGFMDQFTKIHYILKMIGRRVFTFNQNVSDQNMSNYYIMRNE